MRYIAIIESHLSIIEEHGCHLLMRMVLREVYSSLEGTFIDLYLSL